ncbi:MAG: thiamine pyrophosphate-binding protein, partial [Rhodospirillales bacterium]|nr:thiamine pyrophosphate-binding protein [Rhodospirillales bacterium]
MGQITTAEAIVQTLVRQGVDTIFGLPGVQTYELFDALHKAQDQINLVTVRHEQAAAYMAFGYAQSTGKVGVYTVVPGPGVLNSAAALSTAYACNTPVLCVTSEINSAGIGKRHGLLHELPDQLGTLQSFIKWADMINSPEEAPAKVEEAFRQMLNGQPGPVALETPHDIMGVRGDVDIPKTFARSEPAEPMAGKVTEAAKLIAGAKRPMIFVGGGAKHAGEEVVELAERLGAPVGSYITGRGIIPDDHPLGVTLPMAREFWPETDLLIGIGSRLEAPYRLWNKTMAIVERPAEPKLVRIDVYETELARLPADVSLCGDAKLAVRSLVDALSEEDMNFEDRNEKIAAVKANMTEAFQALQPQISYLNIIRDLVPRDGFFVEELTQIGFTSAFAYPVLESRTYVTCGYQGTLGFGFPTALGVKYGNPDKDVVSVTGDGGFMFGVQDLATAALYGIGLVTVIFNNDGYGNVRRSQEKQYDGRVIGSDLKNPDFMKLADAFEVGGYRVEDPDSFKNALVQALELSRSDNQPALIEVVVEPGSEAAPWPFIHGPG